jgi:hypothetical protein
MANTTKNEMAQTIISFVNGTCGEWDWDDLTSIKQRDPELEAIRQRLAAIRDEFPCPEGRAYCCQEGIAELLRIAESLRNG